MKFDRSERGRGNLCIWRDGSYCKERHLAHYTAERGEDIMRASTLGIRAEDEEEYVKLIVRKFIPSVF